MIKDQLDLPNIPYFHLNGNTRPPSYLVDKSDRMERYNPQVLDKELRKGMLLGPGLLLRLELLPPDLVRGPGLLVKYLQGLHRLLPLRLNY